MGTKRTPTDLAKTGIIGVLGGMGPAATVQFQQYLLEESYAECDQEHARTIVVNDPTVPDRTAAIINGGRDPVPHLVNNARTLEESNVDVIAVPCNTFHFFYEEVQSFLSVPIVHMIAETVRFLDRQDVRTVGLLATEGTIRTGLYHGLLEEADIDVLKPRDPKALMNALYAIKAGDRDAPRREIRQSYADLLSRGADVVIAGCTEVPLVLDQEERLVNPSRILAVCTLARLG